MIQAPGENVIYFFFLKGLISCSVCAWVAFKCSLMNLGKASALMSEVHLGTPLLDRLLALPENIQLSWKGLGGEVSIPFTSTLS